MVVPEEKPEEEEEDIDEPIELDELEGTRLSPTSIFLQKTRLKKKKRKMMMMMMMMMMSS